MYFCAIAVYLFKYLWPTLYDAFYHLFTFFRKQFSEESTLILESQALGEKVKIFISYWEVLIMDSINPKRLEIYNLFE